MSVRGARAIFLLGLGLALGCAGAYAERPPETRAGRGAAEDASTRDGGEATVPAGEGPGSDRTVVGHVTPDGRLHADTVAAAPAPDPVERETVVTGHVRAGGSASAPAPGQAVRAESGWRIQVFAAQDEATAKAVARRVGIALDGVPVYVEPDGPWFKVRLGDFPTREAAEPLRERLVGLGWTEAWAVRTTVRAPR